MLDEMRTFVLFAEEGSVQKVARRLPLTQPAVSRQIQRLEQALGTKLLDRRQKPPALTPAGQDILVRSRRILTDYENMKAHVTATEPEGMLRLGLVNGLAHGSLAKGIVTALAQFPRVSLRLKSGWSAELAEQHRLGLVDAAVVLSDPPKIYDADVIGEERLAVIGATALPDTRESVCSMGWILSPEPCDARRKLTSVLAHQGRRLTVAAEIGDAGLQIALVRMGLGLGLMPKRLLVGTRPEGVKEMRAIDPELSLHVMMLRSPHLGSLAKVVDAVSREIKSFIAEP